MSEKISHGIHHMGEMLSIPKNETLAAVYGEVPHPEQHTTRRKSETMEQIAHAAGHLISIPKQEAVDACDVNADHRVAHHGEHGQRRKSLSEQIQDGMHHMGAMLTIPRNETLAAVYGEVPHPEQHTTRRKSETMEQIANAAGHLISIPKQEAVDACVLNADHRVAHHGGHGH